MVWAQVQELSLWVARHFPKFLFFRVVFVEVSLNNGINFIKSNANITSKNCVTARVSKAAASLLGCSEGRAAGAHTQGVSRAHDRGPGGVAGTGPPGPPALPQQAVSTLRLELP